MRVPASTAGRCSRTLRHVSRDGLAGTHTRDGGGAGRDPRNGRAAWLGASTISLRTTVRTFATRSHLTSASHRCQSDPPLRQD